MLESFIQKKFVKDVYISGQDSKEKKNVLKSNFLGQISQCNSQ